MTGPSGRLPLDVAPDVSPHIESSLGVLVVVVLLVVAAIGVVGLMALIKALEKRRQDRDRHNRDQPGPR